MLKRFRFDSTAATVCCLCLISLSATPPLSGQTGSSIPAPEAPPPQLKLRPAPASESKKSSQGRMRLDVVVTDAAGTPVAGLGPQDFQVFDNDVLLPAVTFHALDGTPGKPSSQLAVFLVIDTVNSGLGDVSAMRDDIVAFLRQNGGHLDQPVTLLLFTDAGFEMVGHTSLDGNLLAQAVHDIKPSVHTIRSASGGEAMVERFQLSGRALGAIVAHEVPIPGRKLMIWMGPGWPILPRQDATYNARSHALNYQALAELTNQLGQARMVLCSAGGGSEFFVHDYLKPVKTESEADSDNLALQVLALHSGGSTLNSGNHSHSAELINTCMQESGPYYTLTFDPPHADKAMQYHALKVTLDKPKLTVHTSAGYYSEP